jgi:hypothetical protein
MKFRGFLKKNFDDLAILTAFGRILVADEPIALAESEYQVLAAIERSTNDLHDASFSQVQDYLQGYDEDQIGGLVSNIKGIYHELEFVKFENEDGDTVYAALHDSTNHPGTDVVLFDTETGESSEVQLKAVGDQYSIERWAEDHPGIDIYATEEVAEVSGVYSSGFNNDELNEEVSGLVDQIRAADDPLTVMDQFPALSIASVGVAVWLLYSDYRADKISLTDFKVKAAAVSGIKVAKMGLFIVLLSIPVVGQITGAALLIKLLLSLDLSWFDRPPNTT